MGDALCSEREEERPKLWECPGESAARWKPRKVRDEGLNAVRVEGWQKKMSQPCKASEAQRLDDMSITWFGKACTTF